MEKVLQLDTQSFLNYYDSCSLEIRESLKSLFEKQINEYLMFIIKDYKSACTRLYGKAIDIVTTTPKSVAFIKLDTITQALNDGWTPTPVFFYPTFEILDGKFKFKDVKQSKPVNVFPTYPILKYRNPELAQYSGEQFIKLWEELYK